MDAIVIILHVLQVIIAVATVLVILVQTSKGNGLDSTLGGAANQVLGGQAAPEMLKKLTRILVAAFFVICVVLAFQQNRSVAPKASKAAQKFREQAQTQTETVTPPVGDVQPLAPVTETENAGEETAQPVQENPGSGE